eukprot:6902327-Alexandrium_andersonii.AAC.1
MREGSKSGPVALSARRSRSAASAPRTRSGKNLRCGPAGGSGRAVNSLPTMRGTVHFATNVSARISAFSDASIAH